MNQEYSRVTIPNTEVRYLRSSFGEQEYKLSIALPRDFTNSKKTYPVVYVLDEFWLFAMYTQIVRTMRIYQEVSEAIIVGIGYATDIEADIWALRMRDFTPTIDNEFVENFTEITNLPLTKLTVGAGGAEKHLKFVDEEVIPFIEANYGGNSERRIITGWSLGGLFGLYTLLHRPKTFSDYLILSPSLWWDGGVVFELEAKFAQEHSELPVRLFLSVGRSENDKTVQDVERFAAILEKRKYDGLQMTTRQMEDETHLSLVASAFSKGIRTVLKAESRPPEPEC